MFISHPLDTVKTNMQSGNMRFVEATKILFKTEGVSFFFEFHVYTRMKLMNSRLIITGKIVLSWPFISIVFNGFLEFRHFWCLWQFISNLSRYVSK